MAKIQNVSGDDRVVPSLGGGRMVLAGQVIDVPEGAVYGFTCQGGVWEPHDAPAQEAHDAAVAALRPPEDVDPIEALLAPNAPQVIAAVAAVDDIDTMVAALVAEQAAARPRKSVVEAIEARLAELKPPPNDTITNPDGENAGGDSQEG